MDTPSQKKNYFHIKIEAVLLNEILKKDRFKNINYFRSYRILSKN